MNICGYGEDFLTLWTVKNEMQSIIREIEEMSNSNKPLILYRPSFGRGGRSLSNFGEFDLIFATNKIYLVESKWERSSEVRGGQRNKYLRISATQEIRHKKLEWYLIKSIEYLNRDFNNWNDFRAQFNQEFNEKFQYIDKHGDIRYPTIPEQTSILANNIYNVSKLLRDQISRPITADMIEDILLYFYSYEENMIQCFEGPFTLVQRQFEPQDNSYLVNLTEA